MEKGKKSNRKNEEEMNSARAKGGAAGGDSWEEIGKLCEFNPKNAKNTKDVSRLRSLLLQLKADKDKEKGNGTPKSPSK
jgi:hypothetical protein